MRLACKILVVICVLAALQDSAEALVGLCQEFFYFLGSCALLQRWRVKEFVSISATIWMGWMVGIATLPASTNDNQNYW